MEINETLRNEVAKERKRIQLALKELGYFAYGFSFHGSAFVSIEARPWHEDDDGLINKADCCPQVNEGKTLSMDGVSEPFNWVDLSDTQNKSEKAL